MGNNFLKGDFPYMNIEPSQKLKYDSATRVRQQFCNTLLNNEYFG